MRGIQGFPRHEVDYRIGVESGNVFRTKKIDDVEPAHPVSKVSRGHDVARSFESRQSRVEVTPESRELRLEGAKTKQLTHRFVHETPYDAHD